MATTKKRRWTRLSGLSIGVLKNSLFLIFVLLAGAGWSFEAIVTGGVGEDGLEAEAKLSGLPEIELFQAMHDGFRSEVIVWVRLMKKAQDRFPWIDENREEVVSRFTVWYDKPSRYYFIEDASGRLSGLRTFNEMVEYISSHHVSFSSWRDENRLEDWYLLYRADFKPIRLTEPFQIFLFYPFFQNFATPWMTTPLESEPQWPR